MRTIRFRRSGLLLVAALALLATQTPPAQAHVTMLVAIQAVAILDGPLSNPCMGPGPMPNLAKCPSVVTNDKKIPVGVIGAHTRSVTDLASSVCVAAGTFLGNTADPTSPCAVKEFAAGTVTGSCGLSSGLIQLLVTISWIQGFQTDTLVTVHWTAVGSALLVTGETNPDGKLIVGVVNAVPLPTTTAPPDNSCWGGTADTFDLNGAVILDA